MSAPAKQSKCANCAESIIFNGRTWSHEFPYRPECLDAVPTADSEDVTPPPGTANYEEWKASGVALAARLQSLYDDKVTVHWNETPSEARYFLTIGVNMEGDVIRLLDFAKKQGII